MSMAEEGCVAVVTGLLYCSGSAGGGTATDALGYRPTAMCNSHCIANIDASGKNSIK